MPFFSTPSTGSGHPGKFNGARDILLPRIDDSQALHNLEITVVGLGDVHIHSQVTLTGHHFGRTARSLGDLGAVDVVTRSNCSCRPAAQLVGFTDVFFISQREGSLESRGDLLDAEMSPKRVFCRRLQLTND